MRTILHKLRDSYATYHTPAEPLATDEITVALKGSVIFMQYMYHVQEVRTPWVYKAFTRIFYTFILTH
jgi:hypothetical protein